MSLVIQAVSPRKPKSAGKQSNAQPRIKEPDKPRRYEVKCPQRIAYGHHHCHYQIRFEVEKPPKRQSLCVVGTYTLLVLVHQRRKDKEIKYHKHRHRTHYHRHKVRRLAEERQPDGSNHRSCGHPQQTCKQKQVFLFDFVHQDRGKCFSVSPYNNNKTRVTSYRLSSSV